MNEIKKCPFCGSKPVIMHTRTDKNNGMYIEPVFSVEHELVCPTCEYKFGYAISHYTFDESGQIKTAEDGYKELVDRWNKRVEEPQEQKES